MCLFSGVASQCIVGLFNNKLMCVPDYFVRGNIMKAVLRLVALVLAGSMLFMGVETLLPSSPGFMTKSTALVFVVVGIYFAFYGITGRSSFFGK